MAKRNKYRGSSLKGGIELYGVSELLKQIEAAGGKVDEAVKKTVNASLKVVGDDMQNFMSGHKLSGDTYESFEIIPATNSDTVKVGRETYRVKSGVTGSVGYNIKEGGLPAIFLDVGTPKQRPYFFRYYAVNNNTKRLAEIQRATLNEILEGLK